MPSRRASRAQSLASLSSILSIPVGSTVAKVAPCPLASLSQPACTVLALICLRYTSPDGVRSRMDMARSLTARPNLPNEAISSTLRSMPRTLLPGMAYLSITFRGCRSAPFCVPATRSGVSAVRRMRRLPHQPFCSGASWLSCRLSLAHPGKNTLVDRGTKL